MSADAVAFARLIDALTPWRDRIILVGGWAHRLHRLHPDAAVPSYQPIITRDVDLAVGGVRRVSGNIATALKDAGFTETLSSDHTPPISHYTFGEEDQGFYAEFLTPLRGDGIRRDGSENATTSIAGVSAQNLRQLDVLLVAPWRLDLEPSEAIPIGAPTTLLVANPVSYMAQKLLIHADRRGSKKAQDILYLNDTLELFGGKMSALNAFWVDQVRPTLTSKQLREIRNSMHAAFRTVGTPVRDAARISSERKITPNEIQRRCATGLSELFT